MRATVPAPSVGARPDRGSVLLTALIFVAILGMVLVPLLNLSRTTMQISNRAVYRAAAHDLAEAGLEEGLWSLNKANSGSGTAWSGWTISGSNATRKFTGFTYANGVTGEVNVLAENYAGSPPAIIARSKLILPNGPPIERWLRIGTATRGLFAFGLLARDSITMSGGGWVDSWKSDPDNNPATPPVAWSSSVALDNGALATVSTATPSISIGSADVYGKVAVGASSNAGLAISWGGQVGPRGMAISGSYNLAPGALTPSFTASFETVTAPTGATTTSAYTLPRSVSGPPYYLAAETIGTAGASTILQLDQVRVGGAAVLTIQGDVTMILPPSVISTLIVEGSGRIQLASGATLKIYTPGNITISGAGITNPSAPESMQIWSTRNGSLGQTISLQGSGALNAIIYAPDARLTLPGSTDFSGAAVVYTAQLTGSGAYHFDENLKNFGSGGSLTISDYTELDTTAKRASYAAALNF